MTGGGPERPASGRADISHLRHELRTLVNHILGYGELLTEEVEEWDRPDLTDVLATVIDTGKQVLSEVDKGLSEAGQGAGRRDLPALRLRLMTLLERAVAECDRVREVCGESATEAFGRDLGKVRSAAVRMADLASQGLSPRAAGDEIPE